jgi:hypothetical protein
MIGNLLHYVIFMSWYDITFKLKGFFFVLFNEGFEKKKTTRFVQIAERI